jgi:transcriptional regulator with XRE-family HTH domain
MELASLISVSVDSIRRWESHIREPRASDIQNLCEVLGVSEAEILNGPKEEGYTVTLKFVKSIEEAQCEMMINGNGAVSLADDGTVVASHLGKLFNREDKAAILAALDEKLEEALEIVNRRAERKTEREGSK